jgi:hypothetical protein
MPDTIELQLGLDSKNKAVDDLADVVEVTEEVDEDQLIENEVSLWPLAQ